MQIRNKDINTLETTRKEQPRAVHRNASQLTSQLTRFWMTFSCLEIYLKNSRRLLRNFHAVEKFLI